ncbi:MAG: tRNA (N(6)-L-threonylcarbamoyladenosine(37)-C(2))-methylthiotransferase MtaB [Ruminococcus sp.]|nr:tRNA (N(6)-L-threonylcarbamoyladenosine(37)-C(2))-methylthiotransferase MtaB [Ruminococcus sp.]
MTFKIITLGCKVNTYESEYIEETLKKVGFIYDEKKADIIIVNTCSVTNTADSKSLKMVRRERRENPKAILVVCGCSTQNKKEKYEDLGINILIGNRGKSDIVTLIKNYIENKKDYEYFNYERKLDFENMNVSKFTTHTRAFIKVQDGCDNFCSYCIIPYTRGSIRSKDFNTVLKEAEILVNNGHKEIVLTGIHTGSYNSDNYDLSDLLVELEKIDGLERIRISSIEITELNNKFLNVLKNDSKICNHLHVPLQSGSENVLKRMNRKYDKEYFRNKIKEIRLIRPDISLTTDVIVGHPYETNEDFLECVNFCKEINFSKIHVFPYSLRDGTAAASMPQVDSKLKKERTKELLNISLELENKYIEKFLNKEIEVLTEEYAGDYTVGHTSNYLKVYLKGELHLNSNYVVKITEIKDNNIYGEVLTCLEK